MPQESIYYAAGRLSIKQREIMDASRLERLLSTSSFEEAKRTLSEIGWASAEEADYEQLALDRDGPGQRAGPRSFHRCEGHGLFPVQV